MAHPLQCQVRLCSWLREDLQRSPPQTTPESYEVQQPQTANTKWNSECSFDYSRTRSIAYHDLGSRICYIYTPARLPSPLFVDFMLSTSPKGDMIRFPCGHLLLCSLDLRSWGGELHDIIVKFFFNMVGSVGGGCCMPKQSHASTFLASFFSYFKYFMPKDLQKDMP